MSDYTAGVYIIRRPARKRAHTLLHYIRIQMRLTYRNTFYVRSLILIIYNFFVRERKTTATNYIRKSAQGHKGLYIIYRGTAPVRYSILCHAHAKCFCLSLNKKFEFILHFENRFLYFIFCTIIIYRME